MTYRPNIVVWCKERTESPRAIPPCVRHKDQDPPCQNKLCDAMLNYLRDMNR